MNKIATMPKKIAHKDDVVVISRIEYETLLKKSKMVPVMKLTPRERKTILKSEKELAAGKYLTLKELEHELVGSRASTGK